MRHLEQRPTGLRREWRPNCGPELRSGTWVISLRSCTGVGTMWSALSGGAPVLVMKSTEVRKGDDASLVRWDRRPWLRRLLV